LLILDSTLNPWAGIGIQNENMDAYTEPDASHALLLTIDVQNDFTLPGAPAEIAGTAAAVPQMVRLVEAFRRAGQPVIHMIRLHRQDGSNVDLCRRAATEQGWSVVAPGSSGADIVPSLNRFPLQTETLLAGDPQPAGSQEWILYKPRWGAFYRTALERMIADLHVNTVVVCGCNFPNCPRATIYEASERDLRVVAVDDALSGLYDQGRRELENIGVRIMDSESCRRWLAAAQ
jgi:nicotinamidase-related amidase